VRDLRHAAEHESGVKGVESVRARWLGHRLHAEMTLAVDPALSVTGVRKLPTTLGATLKATLPHWKAYMWKRCRPQAGRDLITIHTPNTNPIPEPPPPNPLPTRSRQLSVGASSPMKRSRAKAAASAPPPMVAIMPSAMAAVTASPAPSNPRASE